MILIKYFEEKTENFDINLSEKAQVDSFSQIEARPFAFILKIVILMLVFHSKLLKIGYFYVPSVTLLKVLHLTNLTTSSYIKNTA